MHRNYDENKGKQRETVNTRAKICQKNEKQTRCGMHWKVASESRHLAHDHAVRVTPRMPSASSGSTPIFTKSQVYVLFGEISLLADFADGFG